MSFKKALKVALEGETDDSIAAVLEEAILVEDSATPAEEIVEQVRQTEAVTDVLTEIAEAADTAVVSTGDPVVAVESLSYALSAVLTSHGVKTPVASLESHDKQEQLRRVSEVANQAAAGLRKAVTVAMEDFAGDIRGDINKKIGVVSKAKSALSKAISQVNSRSDDIEQRPVVINHAGIYDFLHRDGELVQNLRDALKPEIRFLEALKEAIKEIGSEYHELTTDNDSKSDDAIQKFVRQLAAMNYRKYLGQFEGTRLLVNGTVELHESEEESTANMMALTINYVPTMNDGSKASAFQRFKWGVGTAIGGAALGAVGGVVPAVVIGPVGFVLGAAVGAGIGGTMGARKADYTQRGKETNTSNTVEDVIEFLKDAQKISDMADDLNGILNTVVSDHAKLESYLAAILATMSNSDQMGTAIFNTVSSILVPVLTGGRTQGPQIADKKETVRNHVSGMLSEAEFCYYSAVGTYVEHVFNCVKGAMMVADEIVRSETN